jgi:hypothetical protein
MRMRRRNAPSASNHSASASDYLARNLILFLNAVMPFMRHASALYMAHHQAKQSQLSLANPTLAFVAFADGP